MDKRSTSAPEFHGDRRLKDKVAVVVGAGQTPGETTGNGRATSILFARLSAPASLRPPLFARMARGYSWSTATSSPPQPPRR